MRDTMEKYGSLPQDIRFELDDWVLVRTPEEPEGAGLDVIHGCDRRDLQDTHIAWSYCLPGSAYCPGCNEYMPDEIQGMYQLANMDVDRRFPAGWMQQELDRSMRRKFREFEKGMFLTGAGYVEKGCKS